MTRQRNTIAKNPLLRKGGAHEKTASGKRQKDKRELDKHVKEWTKEKRNDEN